MYVSVVSWDIRHLSGRHEPAESGKDQGPETLAPEDLFEFVFRTMQFSSFPVCKS